MLISDMVKNPCATVVPNERFAFGALGIDMDELVILDHIGINVDPLLIDQMP